MSFQYDRELHLSMERFGAYTKPELSVPYDLTIGLLTTHRDCMDQLKKLGDYLFEFCSTNRWTSKADQEALRSYHEKLLALEASRSPNEKAKGISGLLKNNLSSDYTALWSKMNELRAKLETQGAYRMTYAAAMNAEAEEIKEKYTPAPVVEANTDVPSKPYIDNR